LLAKKVCEQHLAELERSLRHLKGAQFSGQVIKFKATKKNTESIGAIEYDTIEMPLYLTTKKMSNN
jgi:hypothetical protein